MNPLALQAFAKYQGSAAWAVALKYGRKNPSLCRTCMSGWSPVRVYMSIASATSPWFQTRLLILFSYEVRTGQNTSLKKKETNTTKTHTHTHTPFGLNGISEVVGMLVCDWDGFDLFIFSEARIMFLEIPGK